MFLKLFSEALQECCDKFSHHLVLAGEDEAEKRDERRNKVVEVEHLVKKAYDLVDGLPPSVEQLINIHILRNVLNAYRQFGKLLEFDCSKRFPLYAPTNGPKYWNYRTRYFLTHLDTMRGDSAEVPIFEKETHSYPPFGYDEMCRKLVKDNVDSKTSAMALDDARSSGLDCREEFDRLSTGEDQISSETLRDIWTCFYGKANNLNNTFGRQHKPKAIMNCIVLFIVEFVKQDSKNTSMDSIIPELSSFLNNFFISEILSVDLGILINFYDSLLEFFGRNKETKVRDCSSIQRMFNIVFSLYVQMQYQQKIERIVESSPMTYSLDNPPPRFDSIYKCNLSDWRDFLVELSPMDEYIKSQECPICCCDFSTDSAWVISDCRHLFCGDCLKLWFHSQHKQGHPYSCPVCRGRIKDCISRDYIQQEMGDLAHGDGPDRKRRRLE